MVEREFTGKEISKELILTNRILALGIVAPALFSGIWILSAEIYAPRPSQPFANRFKLRDVKKFFLQSTYVITAFALISSILVDFELLKAILPLLFTFLLFLYYNGNREREVKRLWKSSFDSQLPSAVQIIAILVASGISPIRSISILADNSKSIVGNEFRKIVEDVGYGRSLIESLDNFAVRVETNLARRFASTLAMSIERGSPLAQTLSEFVRDARSEEKNSLQRKAGKAKILLMIPVIFLILPISVLFALWPSLMRFSQLS